MLWMFTGIDFEHTAGRLSFESGESHKMISIPLIGTPKIGTFMLCLKAISENSGIQVSCIPLALSSPCSLCCVWM